MEFAEQLRRKGRSIAEAAIEAAELRLRPILMTSFAFILGVLPLVFATGAGALGRRSVGTTIVGGMLLSTVLNLIFIPVLYVILSRLLRRERSPCVREAGQRPRAHASLLVAVRDDVVLDPVVDFAGDDALIEQILLGAVGPEAHNAAGPAARHAGNLQQLIDGGVIDIDARLRRRSGCGGFGAPDVSRSWICAGAAGDAQEHARSRPDRCNSAGFVCTASIFCFVPACAQGKDLTAAGISH